MSVSWLLRVCLEFCSPGNLCNMLALRFRRQMEVQQGWRPVLMASFWEIIWTNSLGNQFFTENRSVNSQMRFTFEAVMGVFSSSCQHSLPFNACFAAFLQQRQRNEPGTFISTCRAIAVLLFKVVQWCSNYTNVNELNQCEHCELTWHRYRPNINTFLRQRKLFSRKQIKIK